MTSIVGSAEVVCGLLDERGWERVQNPVMLYEWELKPRRLVRVCPLGAIFIAAREDLISERDTDALQRACFEEIVRRGDQLFQMTTILDRDAMRRFIREAARRFDDKSGVTRGGSEPVLGSVENGRQ